MFGSLALGFVALFTVLPPAWSYSNPEACSGSCWAHDPSVIQRASDGKYFKFNTGSGIEIAKADSLNGPWTWEGYALPNGTSIAAPQTTDLWAPDVSLINGQYYMYYAVSTFGSQISTIGLATSATMEVGSWTDNGSTDIASTSADPYNAIDPNLVSINDSYYLNFGSFWHDIYQAQLDSGATKVSGAAFNIEYDATGNHSCEGSFMFYHIPYHYLLWSHGICCNYNIDKPAPGQEYRIMMCRSTSANSGFVDESGVACNSSGGTILLESHGTVYGPGGQGVLNDESLGSVLYYHYANTSIGLADADYQFGWNVLSWGSDDWPTV